MDHRPQRVIVQNGSDLIFRFLFSKLKYSSVLMNVPRAAVAQGALLRVKESRPPCVRSDNDARVEFSTHT